MAATPVIAVLRAFPDEILAQLEPLGRVVQLDPANGLENDADWERADAAFLSAFDPLPEVAIAAASRLRIVSSIGAGLDHVDLDACAARGIAVSNTPRATIEPTADHIFGLLLATARRIVAGDAFIRRGDWAAGSQPPFGLDIAGQTIGIIGMGRIGRAIARRAVAFGMTIRYHDRAPVDAAELGGIDAQWQPIDDLLALSDVVLVQAPLTPETRHMIDAAAFARMKSSAILINGGRGGVVDEDALADALERGDIASAGLDVFEHEPAINPRLLQCPNLVLTPHLGTATLRARQAMVAEALANLRELLAGAGPIPA